MITYLTIQEGNLLVYEVKESDNSTNYLTPKRLDLKTPFYIIDL